MTTSNQRIAILNCTWMHGNLYTVMGEDELLYVADTFFTALGADGVVYVLDTHRIPGFRRDDEGCACPNRNYKAEADAFASRVEQRGSIDPARWSRYVEETPAEREAYNLRCEQDEREWGVL
jgi:hypothetical protein